MITVLKELTKASFSDRFESSVRSRIVHRLTMCNGVWDTLELLLSSRVYLIWQLRLGCCFENDSGLEYR